MKRKKSWTRTLALLLTAALLTPAALAAEEPSSLTQEQKQEDLNVLYENLQEVHPDLFRHTPQNVFEAEKAAVEANLARTDDQTFAMDLQSFLALAGDSHTTSSLGQNSRQMHFFPFSLQWFDGRWYLASIDQSHADSLGSAVTALNGIPMDEILERFSSFVSADNPIKLRRQVGQVIYAAEILEYLGIIPPGGSLTLGLETGELTLSPLSYEEMAAAQGVTLASQREKKPVTAYDKTQAYTAFPLDRSTYYIQYNRCQEDPNKPMDEFAVQVADDLKTGNYRQVLLDLRNNGGGSDGVIQPLLAVLADGVHAGSFRLWGVIGEATFSSAIINAVMIKEAGGFLAGTLTSGSVDHFGATRSFTLPNSGIKVSCSQKWIDMSTLFESARPYDVEPLRPDITVEPVLADYLAGKDTEVEYLLAHGLTYTAPEDAGETLTRGRLLALLYEAAGRPESKQEIPFDDVFPFAYHAEAVRWAAQEGIALGKGGGRFAPARSVTRAETMVFLSRYAAWTGRALPSDPIPFSDEAAIPAWASDAAHQAVSVGLAESGGTFQPSGTLNCGQAEELMEAVFSAQK